MGQRRSSKKPNRRNDKHFVAHVGAEGGGVVNLFASFVCGYATGKVAASTRKTNWLKMRVRVEDPGTERVLAGEGGVELEVVEDTTEFTPYQVLPRRG